jgi:hypothetical protein
MSSALDLDLLTPNSIGNIFLWVANMHDTVSLSGKKNSLEPVNHVSYSMSSAIDLWTPILIENIFLPWVVHMCDMVTLGGKGNNSLESWHRISTSMSSALDLWPFGPNSIGNIFLPWVVNMCDMVHMCDMVSLCGKNNALEPGNRCVYRQTNRQKTLLRRV